jgi:small subunit ribosomal protein S2
VFERLAAPRGGVDDLTKLTGVGPELEKKLNDAGVFHYWQFAAMTDADAAGLDMELKLNGRIARDRWIETAKTLIA